MEIQCFRDPICIPWKFSRSSSSSSSNSNAVCWIQGADSVESAVDPICWKRAWLSGIHYYLVIVALTVRTLSTVTSWMTCCIERWTQLTYTPFVLRVEAISNSTATSMKSPLLMISGLQWTYLLPLILRPMASQLDIIHLSDIGPHKFSGSSFGWRTCCWGVGGLLVTL